MADGEEFFSKKKIQISVEEIVKRYIDQLPVLLTMVELDELDKLKTKDDMRQVKRET